MKTPEEMIKNLEDDNYNAFESIPKMKKKAI